MWEECFNSSLDKPLELDTTSSKVYTYIRKNIELVTVTNGEEEKKEWRYLECKIRKEDYDFFKQIFSNTEEIEAIEDALCELSKE